MKIVLSGFVHFMPKNSSLYVEDEPQKLQFFTFDATNSGMGYTLVGPTSFEYELPDNWNPIAAEIAGLHAQQAAALSSYQSAVAKINERLSKLQALTNDV